MALTRLISIIPSLLIAAGLLAALVITLVWRDRLGRAATFAAAGIGVSLAGELFNVLFSTVVVPLIIRNSDSSMQLSTYFFVSNLILMLVRLAGLGLLLAAVFVGRQPRPTSGPPPQPQPAYPPLQP